MSLVEVPYEKIAQLSPFVPFSSLWVPKGLFENHQLAGISASPPTPACLLPLQINPAGTQLCLSDCAQTVCFRFIMTESSNQHRGPVACKTKHITFYRQRFPTSGLNLCSQSASLRLHTSSLFTHKAQGCLRSLSLGGD